MGTWVISLKHDINQKILNSINHMMISEVFLGGLMSRKCVCVYIYIERKKESLFCTSFDF